MKNLMKRMSPKDDAEYLELKIQIQKMAEEAKAED